MVVAVVGVYKVVAASIGEAIAADDNFVFVAVLFVLYFFMFKISYFFIITIVFIVF